jgi:serine/threonine-protein kinase
VVVRPLAIGGCGVVYAVEHSILRRPAALKVLHSELVSRPDSIARFEREAQLVNLIHHPNVVDIFDFGQLPDGAPWFLMEFLDGEDLGDRLERSGRLSLGETLEVLEPICDALEAAHRSGVIHRDVKASNVFLSQREGRRRVVLLDFGIAKLLGDLEGGITSTQQVLGTPVCMAPEQILNRPVDARTDVYGLGVLAFQMVTGRLPWPEESVTTLRHLHLQAPRPVVSQHACATPAVDQVIARAMSIEPEDRQAGPFQLLAELRWAARGGSEHDRVAAQSCQALGVHVDVRVDASVEEELSDRVVDEVTALMGTVTEALREAGLRAAVEGGSSALLVLPLPQGAETSAQAREAAIRRVLAIVGEDERRRGRDRCARLCLCLHAGWLILRGERPVGGELLRLAAWVPDAAAEGVLATAAALEGTAVETEPVGGVGALVRLRAC